MGQKYEYRHSNNYSNNNTKQIDKVLSTLMKIINLISSLFNEISNDKNYEKQFNLPYYQDTTNWNFFENQFTNYNEYKNINECYQNDENLHIFFSKHNDISKGLNVVTYEYNKNGRQCFNCGNNYSHQCCIACKLTIANCECVFICGLSTPCQWDKCNKPTQYRKCKYYTSNLNDFNHDCKGVVFENGKIITFNSQDSRSYHSYNIV